MYNSSNRNISLPSDLNLSVNIPKPTLSNWSALIAIKSFEDAVHPDIGPLQLLFLPKSIGAGGLNIQAPIDGSEGRTDHTLLFVRAGVAGTFPVPVDCQTNPDIVAPTTYARLCKWSR
jgi:hypothetical protein